MTKKSVVVFPVANIDRAAEAHSLVGFYFDEKTAQEAAAKAQESIKRQIAAWHKAKLVIGRSGKNGCLLANALTDAFVAGGITRRAASNYVTAVREAVQTGKWAGWNKSRPNVEKDGESGGKGGGRGKGKAEFIGLFLKAFNHNEGKTFEAACKTVEKGFEDAKFNTVYDGFIDLLRAAGFEVK